MKLQCAVTNRPSYRNNKKKRRWYKKVRWTYRKHFTTNKCECSGSVGRGWMYVIELEHDKWSWSASTRDYQQCRRNRKGVENNKVLAQRRALDACRKLVGLEY